MDKLQEICATKREEVTARQWGMTLGELDARAAQQSAPRGFRAALETKARDGFALIA